MSIYIHIIHKNGKNPEIKELFHDFLFLLLLLYVIEFQIMVE